jgi:hypothetical protein
MPKPEFTKQQLVAQALRASQPKTREMAMSEKLGDNDMLADVYNRFGPYSQLFGNIDPEKVHLWYNKDRPDAQYNILGKALHPSAKGKGDKHRLGNETFQLENPGDIALIGWEGANPETIGHEALHANRGWRDEGSVRNVEFLSARTKDEYEQNVKDYAGYKGISYEDAEEELLFKMNPLMDGKTNFFGFETQGVRGKPRMDQSLLSKILRRPPEPRPPTRKETVQDLADRSYALKKLNERLGR